MQKNPAGILACAELSQGRCHGESDCGYGNELKQAGVYGGRKVEKLVQPINAKCPEDTSEHQSGHPDRELFSVESVTSCVAFHG